jgi:glycosyltransferase involved in cell wall biosynthesis
MHVGIDIEQFVRDPYGSGIQRVLQQLALHWPTYVDADFVVPVGNEFGLLTPAQAGEVLSIPFASREGDGDGVRSTDLRDAVAGRVSDLNPQHVKAGDLLAIYDAWLLPEVSYLPGVLTRFESMHRCLPTAMIGYDTLPMSEPANYRFRPGTAAWVSKYFRLLATTDSVICISDYARDSILGRLRRDPAFPISVAHPGGDHVAVPAPGKHHHVDTPPRFLRVGTLEARKRPQEILAAFRAAVAAGMRAELVFVGEGSASAEAINADLREAMGEGIGVSWVKGASDAEVRELIMSSSAFMSFGVEGYGIPVLEAIRLGTPVLFDGTQPAADLMVGKGARRINAGGVDVDVPALATALSTWANPAALSTLRAEVDPGVVPMWSMFAETVVARLIP